MVESDSEFLDPIQKRRQRLKDTVSLLPDLPGVYKYYDKEGMPLYVGKARNLKKRVTSYFVNKGDLSFRIRLMVSKIYNIEYTVVSSEYDALLLENSLIKSLKPRYNINLRDDKSYPYLVITNEPFPRIFPTRRKLNNGSEYFGPFSNVGSMKVVLNTIRKLFPIRNCKLNLSAQNIQAQKFNVCLEYHIKLCKGPCKGLQTAEDYESNLKQVRHILKGNLAPVQEYLQTKMQHAAASLQFEDAQNYLDKYQILEKYQARSTVVSSTIHDIDVCNYYDSEGHAFVNYMRIMNGSVVTTDTLTLKKKLDESIEDLLLLAVIEMRTKYQSTAKEVLVPIDMAEIGGTLQWVIPKQGDKKKVLDLSRKNAFQYYSDWLKSQSLDKNKRKNIVLLNEVKEALHLQRVPHHIECFDNSNFQGEQAVSAMVVVKDGVASKKDYRIFNVKTVVGPDDFATMEEVVRRRYTRVLEEKQELPQLIIIDGGKGQLGAAVKVLQELDLMDKLEIVSIAKRLEEIYKPGDPLPLMINKRSQSLKLIQRARDEAHRFGITAHRKKRSKFTIKTELTNIEGVGKATSEMLLKQFKSVKKIKEATMEDLAILIGQAKARKVYIKLHPEAEDSL